MLFWALLLFAPAGLWGEARFELDGYRWLRELSIERSVRASISGHPESLEVSSIETALFLVDAALVSDGYPNAGYTVEIVPVQGDPFVVEWERGELLDIDSKLRASSVTVEVVPGLYHFFAPIQFEGLTAMTVQQAQPFFYNPGYLFRRARQRPFAEARLRGGLRNLLRSLEQDGYPEATAEVLSVETDPASGRVQVAIRVDEGRRHMVQSVNWQLVGEEPAPEVMEEVSLPRDGDHTGPYSFLLVEDVRRSFRNSLYRAGFPDPEVELQVSSLGEGTDRVDLRLDADLETGPRVRIGEIRFEGLGRSNVDFLRSRIMVEEGGLFDRIAIDRSRSRLALLGVFTTVQVSEVPGEGDAGKGIEVRDLVFAVEERDRLRVDLLFGYGTYEQLRGGIEASQRNLFGLAHSQRIKLVKSMKSTRGEYVYTIPYLFGSEITANTVLDGLVREEVSFTRREFGGSMQVETRFGIPGARFGTGYRLERLRSEDFDQQVREVLTESRVGSLQLFHSLNRFDNVLFPRRGYQYRFDVEWSNEVLGADVDFVRATANFSAVRALGEQLRVFTGVSIGYIESWRGGDNLPLNKRFFPGGENSIRGWRQGEAAPRDEAGGIIGAETFTLFQLDLEQDITPSLSLALFFDGLAMDAAVENFPGDEWLATVGISLRYRTVIGPLRLGYGYNVEKRDFDPNYTILFGLGYPF